jgi:hypothetical protein
MSASLNIESDFNFRKFDKRLVIVKTKSEAVRKIAVLDALTNLMFMVQVPEDIDMEALAPNKEYLFNLRILTSKDLSGVPKDFVSFFESIDIDQSTEDFIRAYWAYPAKIRFQLTEVEEA